MGVCITWTGSDFRQGVHDDIRCVWKSLLPTSDLRRISTASRSFWIGLEVLYASFLVLVERSSFAGAGVSGAAQL